MKHVTRLASLFTSFALLAGCSVGISKTGDNPSASFSVPISYQEAHRRADAQGRECLQLPDMSITGTVYTDDKTAVVRLNSPASALPLEQVDIKALGDNKAHVTITVWGVGIWDQHEINAMRKTIETGNVACRSDNYSWNKDSL